MEKINNKKVLIEIIDIFEKYDISPNEAIAYLIICKSIIENSKK